MGGVQAIARGEATDNLDTARHAAKGFLGPERKWTSMVEFASRLKILEHGKNGHILAFISCDYRKMSAGSTPNMTTFQALLTTECVLTKVGWI